MKSSDAFSWSDWLFDALVVFLLVGCSLLAVCVGLFVVLGS